MKNSNFNSNVTKKTASASIERNAINGQFIPVSMAVAISNCKARSATIGIDKRMEQALNRNIDVYVRLRDR
jgi:hypothetical protein